MEILSNRLSCSIFTDLGNTASSAQDLHLSEIYENENVVHRKDAGGSAKLVRPASRFTSLAAQFLGERGPDWKGK